jgi:phytochrome A
LRYLGVITPTDIILMVDSFSTLSKSNVPANHMHFATTYHFTDNYSTNHVTVQKERHPKDTTIMSYSKPSQRSIRSSPSKTQERSHARKLNAEYEESGNSYDNFKLIKAQWTTQSQPERLGHPEKVIAYLQQIQRAKLIQPFGCLLALDEKSFNIIAFSENAPEMLMAISSVVPTVDDDAPKIQIGTNVESIFSGPSVAALHNALKLDDVSSLNPIIVQCKTSSKQMYAIVHRSIGCLVVDFEPVKHTEFPFIATRTSQSYKHAAKAVSKVQSLLGGSMQILCNTVVKEVFDLTGYDRVMAYMFHEDAHGEVIAEVTKPGLEPYLGLHYPATDIPEAARLLYMKNKVRIVYDCRANSVKTIEAKGLPFDISLAGSTLRTPHSCHLEYMENMNSIASLVLAVVINGNREGDDVKPEEPPKELKSRRLWGLLVCHHGSPRYIPFPVRYACEFLVEVFAVHVKNELLLEKQIREKSTLDVQTMLSDMLFHDASPLSIISGSPNIMDLVKCDGAALLHGDRVWRLCITPTEPQIRDIASWLSEVHMDSTGLSTDSLVDAGYPGAASLGDKICGMAMAKIGPNDIVFWFRSHTAADIKWAGAKHDPSDQNDSRRMHPRLSFMAFLELVKMKSKPWNDYEMDAICSLQLLLRDRMNGDPKPTRAAGLDNLQIDDIKLDCLDKLHMVTSEMVHMAEATSPLILALDVNGLLNERNQNNAIKSAKDSCLLSQEAGTLFLYLKKDGLAELQTVTEEMSRLMERTTAPIFAVDANGLVSGWNLKLVELTGLTVEETVGRHILTLVEQSSLPVVQRMLYLALDGM